MDAETTNTPPAQVVYTDAERKALMLQEFIAGGEQILLLALRKALPTYIDDITGELGSDLYERMVKDPDVASALDTAKLAVMAEGVRLAPSHEPPAKHAKQAPKATIKRTGKPGEALATATMTPTPEDAEKVADAQKAQDMLDFVQRRFDEMPQNIEDILYELLDAIHLGHKIAEVTYELVTTGPDSGKLGIKSIKGRPRKNQAFVVDAYNNCLGFIAVMPDRAITALYPTIIMENLKEVANFLPRRKAVVFANDVKNSDPRGTSRLRSIYNAWFLKTQVLPEWFKYLRQFATPALVAKTPPNSEAFVNQYDLASGAALLNSDGTKKVISAETMLMYACLDFLNKQVLVVKGGTEVDYIQSDGEGKAHIAALEYFEKQITKGILGSARATVEAEHGSKADGGQAADIMQLLTSNLRRRLGACATRDIVRVLVEDNFGPEMLKYAPRVVLSKVDKANKAEVLTAYAHAYAAGMIHDSQLPGIDEELDMPERDMEAMMAEKAEAAENEAAKASIGRDLYHPALGGTAGGKDDLADSAADDDQTRQNKAAEASKAA